MVYRTLFVVELSKNIRSQKYLRILILVQYLLCIVIIVYDKRGIKKFGYMSNFTLDLS